MKVIIVGAGITGLSLAIALARSKHSVVILDAEPTLAELGAGIQMTPQAIKYLFQWGMEEDIMAASLIPDKMLVKDYKTGEVLDAVPIGDMKERYGAPYIVVHRAVLHDLLHKHAVAAGAELRLDSKVVNYDFANGAVDLQNGSRLTADLVVGADGIKSFSRKQLFGDQDFSPKSTGWAAIRMLVEVAKGQADPLLAEVADLETHNTHFWIAPGKSCMTYQIRDGTLLNIVLSHKDDVDMSQFTLEEYRAYANELYKDFHPTVRRLLELSLPKIQNYPIYAVPQLPTWVDSSGRFTLLGDAAHAMSMYLSMGVSLAVEDAASLATVLELACPVEKPMDYSKLKTALQIYEKARRDRVTNVQAGSLHAGNMAHVEDVEMRKQLYETLRADGVQDPTISDADLATQGITYGMADQRLRDWYYHHETAKYMEECYKSMA